MLWGGVPLGGAGKEKHSLGGEKEEKEEDQAGSRGGSRKTRQKDSQTNKFCTTS